MITLLMSLAIIADPAPFDIRPPVVRQPVVTQLQPPCCYVTNQATFLALELTRQQIQLAKDQARYVDNHPMLERQQQRITALQKAVDKRGDDIEQKYVKATLAKAIARTQAELTLGQQDFTAEHPKLKQLRSHLKRLKDIDNAGKRPPAPDKSDGNPNQ